MNPLARAAIVAVGSELLTPSRIDTNSLYITEQLNLLGIDVVIKAIVGDDREELGHICRAALSRVDLVVFSGGLGPTDDDLTREVVAGVLGGAPPGDGRVQAGVAGRLKELFRNSAVLAVNIAHVGSLGVDETQESGKQFRSIDRPLPYAVPTLAATAMYLLYSLGGFTL